MTSLRFEVMTYQTVLSLISLLGIERPEDRDAAWFDEHRSHIRPETQEKEDDCEYKPDEWDGGSFKKDEPNRIDEKYYPKIEDDENKFKIGTVEFCTWTKISHALLLE